jgi:hypothetical protein
MGLMSLLGCTPEQVESVEARSEAYTVSGMPTLIVEGSNGSVRIEGREDLSEIQVVATLHAFGNTLEQAQERLEKLTVTMRQVKDKVTLTYQLPKEASSWRRRPTVDFDVLVPRATNIQVKLSNGNATVEGVVGSISAETENGNIASRDVEGLIAFQTNNGNLTVARATGPLSLKTSNGTIDVEAANVALDAQTSNGDVHFSGRFVGPEHRMQSSNGSLDVEIPPDSELSIEASVGTGSISTTLPLTGDIEGKSWSAILNLPTSYLSLRTGNGSIQIRGLSGI